MNTTKTMEERFETFVEEKHVSTKTNPRLLSEIDTLDFIRQETELAVQKREEELREVIKGKIGGYRTVVENATLREVLTLLSPN